MITNDEGYVALQHYNTNPKSVSTNDGTIYTFTPKHNVSLAWVRPEHVDEMLQKQQKICCGKFARLCLVAGELNVKIWLTGNR